MKNGWLLGSTVALDYGAQGSIYLYIRKRKMVILEKKTRGRRERA